jgi:hypothetical protein
MAATVITIADSNPGPAFIIAATIDEAKKACNVGIAHVSDMQMSHHQ